MNDTARYPETEPNPSEVLAGFVANLDVADVPDDVVGYARVLMLDLLARRWQASTPRKPARC